MRIFLIAGILAGCETSDPAGMERQRMTANRTCTPEQVKSLTIEFEACKRTGYFNTFCFEVAKIGHCSKIDSAKP